jgi:hypothetical protein
MEAGCQLHASAVLPQVNCSRYARNLPSVSAEFKTNQPGYQVPLPKDIQIFYNYQPIIISALQIEFYLIAEEEKNHLLFP